MSPVIEGDVVVRRADETDPRRGEMMRVLGVDILQRPPHPRLRARRDLAEAANNQAAKAGAKAGRAEALRRSAQSAQDFLNLLLDPQSIVLTRSSPRGTAWRSAIACIFVIGDREHEAVIRGLLRDEGPAKVIDGNFALMDIAAAQWALDRLGRIDRLDVQAARSGGDRSQRAGDRRAPARGPHRAAPERRGRQVERMLAAFHLNLTALSYIALLVGLFLVYNTVSTSVIARREEIGTLRALGVTQRQVLALFLGEAAALACPGRRSASRSAACWRDAAVGADLDDRQHALHRRGGHAACTRAQRHRSWPCSSACRCRCSPRAAGARGVARARRRPRCAARIDSQRVSGSAGSTWPCRSCCSALDAWLATFDATGGLPVAGYASALALVFGAASLVPSVLFVRSRLARRILRACRSA